MIDSSRVWPRWDRTSRDQGRLSREQSLHIFDLREIGGQRGHATSCGRLGRLARV